MRVALFLISCLSVSVPPGAQSRLYGTVVYAGKRPNFPNDGCDVHAWDIEGRTNITGGLSHAVVVAEPLAGVTRRWFRGQPSPPVSLGWDPAATDRVMTVRPDALVSVDSRRPLTFCQPTSTSTEGSVNGK